MTICLINSKFKMINWIKKINLYFDFLLIFFFTCQNFILPLKTMINWIKKRYHWLVDLFLMCLINSKFKMINLIEKKTINLCILQHQNLMYLLAACRSVERMKASRLSSPLWEKVQEPCIKGLHRKAAWSPF